MHRPLFRVSWLPPPLAVLVASVCSWATAATEPACAANQQSMTTAQIRSRFILPLGHRRLFCGNFLCSQIIPANKERQDMGSVVYEGRGIERTFTEGRNESAS